MKEKLTCIIPAAGYGTRTFPATIAIPKEMLPVGPEMKPVIQIILENLQYADVGQVVLVTSKEKEKIFKTHFSHPKLKREMLRRQKLDIVKQLEEVEALYPLFTHQDSQKGWTDAVRQAQHTLEHHDDFFMVTFADSLFDSDFYQRFVEKFREVNEPVFALIQVPDDELYKYGVAEFSPDESNQIISMVEKPSPGTAPSNWIFAGAYIFPIEFFDAVEDASLMINGEYNVDEVFRYLFDRYNCHTFKYEGNVFDIGSPQTWYQANQHYFQKDLTEGYKKTS